MKRAKIAGGILLFAITAYGVALLAGLEDEATTVNSVVIDRPPEVVFDYAADMRHELEWNPEVQSMAKVTDGPVGRGTRFAAKWKQSEPVIVECTRFDRPRSWTWVNGGALAVDIDITLTPQGAGTLLVSRFHARPHGFLKVIFPVFKIMMAKFEKANMEYLKKAIESHPAEAREEPRR